MREEVRAFSWAKSAEKFAYAATRDDAMAEFKAARESDPTSPDKAGRLTALRIA